MRRKQTLKKAIVFVACALAMCTNVFAESYVHTTTESGTDADSIYIAGNPDCFPLEYYDKESRSYQGIMPEILKKVGKSSGLNFTYVYGGTTDNRQELAKNGQVEIVSGLMQSSDDSMRGVMSNSKLMNITADGKKYAVCFGYTEIADEALVSTLNSAFREISSEEIAALAVEFTMNKRQSNFPLRMIVALTVTAVVLIIFAIHYAVRMKKLRNSYRINQYTDEITGIGNAKYFEKAFSEFITDSIRVLYYIVYFQFNISATNKYSGDNEGKNVLLYAAKTLEKAASDREFVARTGSGSFVFAHQDSSDSNATEWVERTLALLNDYGDKFKKGHHPEFHAGIYHLKIDNKSCETAVYNARQAAIYAENKSHAFEVCNETMLKDSVKQGQLSRHITEAYKNNEFKLYMQVVASADSGKICGFEVLSRWEHPTYGMVSPEKYISIMESTGTVAKLDFYMFERVCKCLDKWSTCFDSLPFLSCNFSRMTICSEKFIENISRIIDSYAFDHSKLIIEITESTIDMNKNIAFQNMNECKKLGFRIALDDFGSGYTSFLDLRDFPIDIVKIDQNVLLTTNTERGKSLLTGLIDFSHKIGMKVICEGIENDEQRKLLYESGCDQLQGYLFSHALPQEVAEELWKKQKQI